MYCIRCGRESQAGASFCWNCGAALGAPSPGPVVDAAPVPAAPPADDATVLPAAVPGAPAPPSGWQPFDPANPPAAPPAPAGPAGGSQWARPFEPVAAGPAMPAVPATAAGTDSRAGGFWRRVWASLIDSILLNVLNMPFALLWVSPHYEALSAPDITPDQFSALMGGYLLAGTTGFLISWIYHAGLESSAAQATLGKMALGVKVCDRESRRLSFGHATGRFFSKLVSNLTFGIGYLMAAFTARKRALHDMIAGTLVVRG